jgi:tetratricopeptide (TPR) repeat protein
VVETPVAPPPEPIVKPPEKPAPAAPKGPKALLAQAAKLREKGDVERALDLYGRVAEEDPENVEALTGRGLCYLDLERYPPAEASFQAVLGIDPEEPDALLGLAETYRWQGKTADAIRYYEKYLALHPGGEEADVARNALEELRK